ncbi:MAG: Inner membrane protein YrbG [Calditrichaeota bacterium]|nr:Inner membrane protein YrbG [Calditrichota bacterium]
MLTATLLLIGGLVLLVAGGEGTVRGGTSIAERLHMQPYVIGATVVAFGTSAPELAVTVTAAFRDAPGLALGNVVGSNIANLGLILGLSALITPIVMPRSTVVRELPVILGVLALLLAFSYDRSIERWEGIVLLVAMAAVIVHTIRTPFVPGVLEEGVQYRYPLLTSIILLAGGIAALFFGGRFIVSGAVTIAEALGVAEWVIGVVIVAAGTSMPEVAASVVAAYRGRGDIALGNVIGSNTFNVLMVLGAGGTIKPIHVRAEIGFDLVIVSALTLVPGITLLRVSRVPRSAGFLLLAGYLAYLAVKLLTG